MRPYQLTSLAEQDLKEIYRYTIKTWGKKQAKHYAELLEKRFYDIANDTASARSLSDLRPDIMLNRCELTISSSPTPAAKSRKFSQCYTNAWTWSLGSKKDYKQVTG